MSRFIGAAEMLEGFLEQELIAAGLSAALKDEGSLRDLCAPPSDDCIGDLDRAAEWLTGLSVERIRGVIEILTMRFHLRNKSEQLVIAQINRDRERNATREAPRAESVTEAVATLARAGTSLESLIETLSRLEIVPTLTAHPTEARRRAVLRKQARIADSIERLDDPRLTPSERETEESELRRVLLELAVTDEVRSERLDAAEEVLNGLHYLTGSIWRMLPTLYSDLRRAIAEYYGGATPELPTLLRYRSWIGGDRDGNPRVTADITRETLRRHHAAATQLYLTAVEGLRKELSVSMRRRRTTDELLSAIEQDASIDDHVSRHLRLEPYRVRFLQIARKLRDGLADPGSYSAGVFETDLLQIRRSLQEAGLGILADAGPLDDLIRRVRTFGLHLAALDIRQHSEVHESAVDELLRVAGVTDRYAQMDEPERIELLRAELSSPRPLAPEGIVLGEQTSTVLDAFAVVADAVRTSPGSIGTYVVSMTHEVSDVFEVLLLAKEVGLYRPTGPSGDGLSLIDIAPLFETIEDLRRAAGLLDELFAEPLYRAHLDRRDGQQEVMLGYSDSNKDGGYWVANWLLHCAEREVCLAGERAAVSIRLFHGRGGTVGRGGGRANRAILAAPRESRTGRIRFTEQGEVISFRYAMPAIAHRHVEQIVSAMILATHDASEGATVPPGATRIMDRVSQASMSTYRSLIEDPAFWPWYTKTTPIAHISRLPLASRPVMRSPGTADFNGLRAIPWGFAWTQIRATAPGWFGVGAGLAAAIDEDPGALDRFKEWAQTWPFFETIVANAEQELARARLPIARRYAAAAGFDANDPIVSRIQAEYDRTRALLLEITGADDLLDHRPVIHNLIRARNPDTDALNICQIELMGRERELTEDNAELQSALLSSLNGIAAAMQSTG